MNVFGGFFHVGTSDAAEASFLAARDFFESSFQGVSMKRNGAFACWNGICKKCNADSSSAIIHESSCKRYLLTGYFRLDYREELGDKLGIRYADLQGMQDSLLVLHAFEKWKFDFRFHLEGDWSIVIYDQMNHELFLYRDPMGAAALFYLQWHDFFYFSVDPNLFKVIGFPLTIDPEQFFKIGLASGKMDDGKLIIKGMSVLKRGEAICFNGQVKNLEQMPILLANKKLCFRNDEDYVAHFKSTYAAAVRTRLGRGNAGLFLSAGLDSSMLCYFAARELMVLQKKLKTYTSFPKYIDMFPMEKQDRIREDVPVRKFVAGFSNVEACFMDFKEADMAQMLEDNQSDQLVNPLIKPNTFWIHGISKQAFEDGVQTMFVAKMSNYTVSWDAPMIGFFYVTQFQFIKLFHFMRDIAGDNLVKWLKVCKHELLFPFRREFQFMLRRLGFLVLGFRTAKGICRLAFFNTAGLKKWDFSKQFVPGYSSGKNPNRLRQMIFNATIDRVGIFNLLDGIRFGTRVVDPSADRRLVSFSFGLPERLFYQQGKRKFLYRAIMHGLLDEAIINKRVPYPQAYDIGLRLLESPGIKEMMKNLQHDPKAVRLLNVEPSVNDFESMKKWGFQTEGIRKAGTILRLLSMFLLLQQFHIPEKMNKFEHSI